MQQVVRNRRAVLRRMIKTNIRVMFFKRGNHANEYP